MDTMHIKNISASQQISTLNIVVALVQLSQPRAGHTSSMFDLEHRVRDIRVMKIRSFAVSLSRFAVLSIGRTSRPESHDKPLAYGYDDRFER